MFNRNFYNSSEGDGVLTITLVSSLAAEFSFTINVIPIRLSMESKKLYFIVIIIYYVIFFSKIQFLYQTLLKLCLKLDIL